MRNSSDKIYSHKNAGSLRYSFFQKILATGKELLLRIIMEAIHIFSEIIRRSLKSHRKFQKRIRTF
jgi:hypothetical protein